MALCVHAVAGAVVENVAETELTCTGYLLQTADESHAMSTIFSSVSLELLGIDPDTILYVFSWGMGAVLSMGALGYAVGSAVTLIKKL